MVQRDSVRVRLDRDGVGISYTEFSYMLLQAHDFLQLARRHGCTAQIGGSDQWGNIVSGIDLARRVLRRQTYALTHPLITKQDGSKLGKSAAGAVWLDPQRTSPFAFHQFWLNTADADVVPFLRCFTLLDLAEIDAAGAAVARQPERREGQRLLAQETTRLVHGEAALESALRIASALSTCFGTRRHRAARARRHRQQRGCPGTGLARRNGGSRVGGLQRCSPPVS